jgi:hypothetical protein
MNDFINGIFRIWEKLPDQSKDAFTQQLGFRERSALHVGSQLLKYYVDLSNQAQDSSIQNPQDPVRQPRQNRRTTRSHSPKSEDFYEYEYDEQTNSYVEKKVTPPSKTSKEEDDDIIDAEWTEQPASTYSSDKTQKPKTTRKRKK